MLRPSSAGFPYASREQSARARLLALPGIASPHFLATVSSIPKNKSCATRACGKTRPHSSRYAPVRIPAFATSHVLSLSVASCRNIATPRSRSQDGVRITLTIMRLLAAASVTDDRINFTRWAAPQNNLGAASGPIRFELVRCGKWDKQKRTSWSSAPALTRQDLSRKRSSFLLKQKIQLKENNPSRLQLLGV